MLTSPTTNTVIGYEDSQKIEAVKARLSLLQAEVLKATKEIEVLRKEKLQAEEDADYAKSILVDNNREVEKSKQNLSSLENSTVQMAIEIKKHEQRINEENKDLNLKRIDLQNRAAAIIERENDLKKRDIVLKENEQNLKNDRDLLEKAKKAFEEAITYIKW